jgi:hypothetical protein
MMDCHQGGWAAALTCPQSHDIAHAASSIFPMKVLFMESILPAVGPLDPLAPYLARKPTTFVAPGGRNQRALEWGGMRCFEAAYSPHRLP